MSETRLPDTTQPPRSPITQTSGGKGLGIPLHEEDSHTTQSLPPLPPTSSKASVTVNLSDTLPAPIPLPQSLSTNNIGELERFSYDAQSIDADLSHELNALTNDPNWNVPRDQQDSDTILSLSSLPPTPRTLAQIPKRFLVHKTLTAISDKEEAIRDRDKCNDLNVQLSQQIFDKAEEEKDKETLNQRALEDQRLRIMFEQFDKRPNVWVVVRFRDKIPSDDGEAPLHYSHARKECHQELSIYRWQDDWVDETQRKKVPSVKERMAPKPYIVDHVFEPSASNIQVFETMKPLIKMFLDGRQICIIADGQSGTGKSYTMLNGPEPIAASAAHMIFDDLNSTKLSGWEYSIECSILEICQERPKDLLHDNKLPAQTNDWIQESIFAPKDIRIQRSDPGLVGCSRHHLKSAKEFIALIRKASKLRTTRKTEKNKHSSRSDLISIISISRSDMITKENIRARFYLVDLVGSESSSDPLLKNTLEVNTIKKGRESLKRAMSAHRNHDDHIPLDNQLTLLLQDCFKAPSKIVLLVTASPLLKDQSTTSTMIDFASEARNYEGKVKSKTSAK